MCYKNVFLLIFLNCLSLNQSSKRPFTMELHTLTCSNFSARLKVFQCGFEKLTAGHYVFWQRLKLDREWGKDVEARVTVEAVPTNGKKIIKFLDLKVNLCDSLKQAFRNPLLIGLMTEVRRSGNMPYSCPFKANFLYKLENLSVSDANFPPYTPLLNYTFTLSLYEKQKLFSRALAKGATVRRPKEN